MDSLPYVPAGYPAVVPYLTVSNAAALLDFLKTVFAAEVKDLAQMPDGRIMHASVTVAGSVIELSDGNEDFPPMPGAIHIYVPDTDATFQKALAAGATVLREPEDMFYGERSACVRDSTGNNWYLATKTEDLTQEEMAARATAAMQP